MPMLLDGFNLENVLAFALGSLMLPLIYALRRGPSTADRVLALEVIGALGTLILLALAIVARRPIYLDLALLATLFSFLGTLVMARYIERGLLR
jgi:multicomponent Na+:H+ antiporter subunit F